MKKVIFLLACAAITLAACTKKTTNTTIMIEPRPAYIISGIHDVTMTNGSTSMYGYTMQISVGYSDSDQNIVSLALSALPAGISMDTTWITSGIPTYNTSLTLFDTTGVGATPGTYPMTLTATCKGVKKTYSFNLKINSQPPCTSSVVGNYLNCYGCVSNYVDNVTTDPVIANKIWFSNFSNSGVSVYGIVNCATMTITIPYQTIGGNTYHGTGNIYGTHYINGDFYTNSSYCSVSMH